jgi:hypothetical protein
LRALKPFFLLFLGTSLKWDAGKQGIKQWLVFLKPSPLFFLLKVIFTCFFQAKEGVGILAF